MLRRKRPLEIEWKDEAPPDLEAHQPAANEIDFRAIYDEGYEYVDETGYISGDDDQSAVEFEFVDGSNIKCGICLQIVPYDTLFSEHMANNHPEFAGYTVEDAHYDAYAQPLYEPNQVMQTAYQVYNTPSSRSTRQVSQIRVNTTKMSLDELESSLRKKMVEKMGRKIPVSLVDKQHARCGICNAVLSLNKKFEIIHLVRHFNAWHPAEHKCTGEWLRRAKSKLKEDEIRPLGSLDFAVIDLTPGAADSLQCTWCGVFIDVNSIAMHFEENHSEEVEIPNCRLCLQELVANSRFLEKFEENMKISLPDEHHFKCGRFDLMTSTESAMDRAVQRALKRRIPGNDESEDEEDDEPELDPKQFTNSRMTLGKRSRPKRQFIMPSLRQAAPINSEFVEPISEGQWTCKLCNAPILAAVISAGAIKHFRQYHETRLDEMQLELCKARLERVSDGCMKFLDSESVECLTCKATYPLHKPYNMCRAIRHLKLKHPEKMPEYNGSSAEKIPKDELFDEEDEDEEEA